MAIESEDVLKKSKKHKKNKNRVGFEEELIDKEKASAVLAKLREKEIEEKEITESQKNSKSKKNIEAVITASLNREVVTRKKGKKSKKGDKLTRTDKNEEENHEENETSKNKRKIDNVEQTTVKKSKKKKVANIEEAKLVTEENNEELSEENNVNSKSSSKTEESIRAKKRRKHEKLLEEKKKKAELAAQENILNYLSKWKHARDQWKFEKLKQNWLSENLFHVSKIPDQFWEITVEYFNGSKGFIRDTIMKNALKIIELEDNVEEENLDEAYQSRLKRARDIVQSL